MKEKPAAAASTAPPVCDLLQNDLVSMVSHELRTPLATIKEFTSIVTDELAGPTTREQREYLGIIQQNVERMIRIIDNLLDVTKIEAGRVLLNRQVVDAWALIQQVVDSLAPLAKSRQLTLQRERLTQPLSVFGDADTLTQVLTNLIGNAIKFTPAPGRITVGVGEHGDEVEFRVADTGVGIGPDDLPKLFEKFQQFQATTELAGVRGSGLGLAISKRLVELHGGRIWADSRLGRGSTFFFTLPKYHVDEVFREHLQAGIARAKQHQCSFSIIVLAIAEFPQLKGRHGFQGVIQLLKGVEASVQEAVRRRAGDIVSRWERGEMVVILAAIDKAACGRIAERIKHIVEDRAYPVGGAEERVHVVTHSATYPEEAANEDELLRIAEQGVRAGGAQAKVRILVVDDEAKIRRFIKEALALHEFDVLTAASGPEALALLKTQPVDLILLDVMMPVMGGYEVYHLLKENPLTAHIPVLIVTAKGDRTDRVLGMESPSYHYLTKPFPLEELLEKVRELLKLK